MTQIILPDTPSAVLQLLNADKQALDRFAEIIANEVKDGKEYAMDVEMWARKNEYTCEKIRSKIKENVISEAAKYGEKPFNYGGAECHYTPTRTEYDFSACGDVVWNDLNEKVTKLTEERKKREAWLKTFQDGYTQFNPETGEMYNIVPPQKKQTYGLKVTLK